MGDDPLRLRTSAAAVPEVKPACRRSRGRNAAEGCCAGAGLQAPWEEVCMNGTDEQGRGQDIQGSLRYRGIRAITLDLDDTLWPVEPVLAYANGQLVEWLRPRAPGTAAVVAANPSVLHMKGRYPEHAHDMSWLRTALPPSPTATPISTAPRWGATSMPASVRRPLVQPSPTPESSGRPPASWASSLQPACTLAMTWHWTYRAPVRQVCLPYGWFAPNWGAQVLQK